MKSNITDFSTSSIRSSLILKPELLEQVFTTYFRHTYLGYEIEEERDAQRSGIDLWINTKEGRIGVDLKGCSQSVEDYLHLEVYSVREDRKLGYILNRNIKSSYLLFVSKDGSWRMFNRDLLATALRANFQHWVRRFGLRIQHTRCAWRKEQYYSSSTICVPTSWIRGAYYAQIQAA